MIVNFGPSSSPIISCPYFAYVDYSPMALLGSILQLKWIKIASVYNQYIWKWGLDFSLNPITLIYLEAWEVA